jgi:hypothetical protein
MVVLLVAAGCSQGNPEFKMTGQVTLDGAALDEGEVRFAPVDGKGQVAGCVVKDGKYETKMAPGKKNVIVSAYKFMGERSLYANDPNSPKVPLKKQIAEKTETLDVTQSGVKDFALTSKK